VEKGSSDRLNQLAIPTRCRAHINALQDMRHLDCRRRRQATVPGIDRVSDDAIVEFHGTGRAFGRSISRRLRSAIQTLSPAG
jgi:CRP-like cAMP-binding protein